MPRNRKRVFRLLALPAALAALPGAGALAAEATLEEVLVTAQRVETNIQTTPVAVTAVSADFIDRFGLRNVTSLQNAAPNLVFNSGTGGSSSQVSAFIRGVGEFDFLLTTDPAVGLYVDGVYMARTFGSNLELSDVERVEILRGPQGTLFGKNNIGGAISVSTRKPTGSGETRLQASAGNYSAVYLDGYTDQAISPTLAIGASALYRKADGWQRRPGPDGAEEDKAGARVTLAWTPSDTVESVLSAEVVDQDQTSNANVMLVFVPGQDFFSPLFNGFVSPANPCCTTNSLKRSNAEGPLNVDDLDGHAFTWTTTWEFAPEVSLKSITGYRKMEAHFGRDGDNSALDYNGDVHDETHRQFSQEFQLTGSGERLNWVAGAYFFDERTRDQTELVTSSGLFDALNGLGAIADLTDFTSPLTQLYLARYFLDFNLDFDNRQETRDYAAYFNLDFALTDKLSLQAGLRYTDETKEFEQYALRKESNSSLFLFTNPFTGQPDESVLTTPSDSCGDVYDRGTRYDCKETWDDISPRLGLTYAFSDELFGYLVASRGFRSGGFDGRPTERSGINDYKPEHLRSYEAGLKALLADNRVRLNTAVFYNEYDDKQVLLSFGTTVVTQNAAEATIWGVESELEAAVTDRFSLRGSIGYTEGEYDEWFDPNAVGGPADYSDRKLRNNPEWTANLAAIYEAPLAGGTLRLSGNASYVDDMYLDSENAEVLHAGSRTLLDAGISWATADERWEVGVLGKNLSDEQELVSGFNGQQFFGYAEGFYNAPRRYFLTLKFNTR